LLFLESLFRLHGIIFPLNTYLCYRFIKKEISLKDADNIILGIDPGTTIMGYGVIDASESQPKMLSMGVVDLRKYSDHYQKLSYSYERVTMLIEQYLPDEIAIEAPFFGKNVQSMLKLGRAQGVAIAAALSHSVPIVEYAPRKIKQSITGSGSASKEQVAGMLMRLLNIDKLPTYLDATDGLAAAVCHFYQRNTPGKAKGNSWADFVKKNPGRIS
jgi:crossover junction endodeoxyribonuclease RuvC